MKKWLEFEDRYIVDNYSKGKKGDIVKYLNRSWCSIQARASKLGIKKINTSIRGRNVKIWDNESINYLLKNYETLDKNVIINYLGRSWSSIQNKAFMLNLKRDTSNYNVSNLINETNESYYWLGFIMADGHFSLNNQIQINLSIKDLNHLNRFAEFIEYGNELKKPSIKICRNKINEWLKDKFNINNNKTYYPCDISKLDGDKLFSFIVGFIDGDGSINKKGYLVIKCHKSWLDNLNLMISYITNGDYNKGKINNEGLALIAITKIEQMKMIKLKCLNLKLPILMRKWGRVSATKYSKQERSNMNYKMCEDLFKNGLSVGEIVSITKLSRAQVYKLKKIYSYE